MQNVVCISNFSADDDTGAISVASQIQLPASKPEKNFTCGFYIISKGGCKWENLTLALMNSDDDHYHTDM